MQKYIIVDSFRPIIFETSLPHNIVAGNLNVTSAGFIENGKCFGRSDSLNIESNESDIKIIKRFLKSLKMDF